MTTRRRSLVGCRRSSRGSASSSSHAVPRCGPHASQCEGRRAAGDLITLVHPPASARSRPPARPRVYAPLCAAHAGAWLQLNLAERDRKRHDLTLHELESLPAGTNTYQSAGRMFLQVRTHLRANKCCSMRASVRRARCTRKSTRAARQCRAPPSRFRDLSTTCLLPVAWCRRRAARSLQT